MAKLVDILARNLTHWPNKRAKVVAQDSDGCVHPYLHQEIKFSGVEWEGHALVSYAEVLMKQIASDYQCTIVTRAQWQAARDALIAENPSLHLQDFGRITRVAPDWNGAGVPSVGIDVEICSDKEFDRWAHHRGQRVTVVGHEKKGGNTIVIYRWIDDEGSYEYHGLACDVPGVDNPFRPIRPIRTAEQIQADERNAIVMQIASDLDVPFAIADQAYAKGYRKQEAQ